MPATREKPTAVLLLPNLTLGGAERQGVELACQLPALGWRPVVVAVEPQGPQRERLEQAGIPIIDLHAGLGAGMRSPRFWASLSSTIVRIRQVCDREHAVVLQSFLFWQNQLAIPAGRLARTVRAVVTGRRNTGEFKDTRPIYQKVENFTNRWSDAVVCNSAAVRDDVLRREHVDPARVHVIANGIDVERFRRVETSIPREELLRSLGSRFIIGTVGNLKAQKRHDLFLRTMAELRKKNTEAAGVVVGRDLGEEKRLRKLATDLGVKDQIRFTGGVDDVVPWLHSFDLFLLTSDHEGMPNALMEAMAAGVPVVTRNVAGVEELIPDATFGRLVTDDPSKMAQALLELLAGEEERRQMSEKAREHLVRNFSLPVMAGKYAALYERLVRGDA